MKKVIWLLIGIMSLWGLLGCSEDDSVSNDKKKVSSGSGYSGPVKISGTAKQLSPNVRSGRLKRNSSRQAEDVAMTNAEVKLVKVSADGTETTVSTTTSGASGEYTFEDIDQPETGTGASDDFYYEVQVTATDGDVLKAPAAPMDEENEVNVTPESNLAAEILTEVSDVPGTDKQPIPDAKAIEAMREATEQNGEGLADSITIPDAGDSTATKNMANGISAAGGNAEKMYKNSQLESEYIYLTTTDETVDSEDTASYVKRAISESCGTNSNPLSEAAAKALGTDLKEGKTYTVQEVIDAYNKVSTTQADSTKIEDYAKMLTELDEISEGGDKRANISDTQQLGLYTKRDLDGSAFDKDTVLDPDQAAAFMMELSATSTAGGTGTAGTPTAPASGGTPTAPASGGTPTAPASGGTPTAPADGGGTPVAPGNQTLPPLRQAASSTGCSTTTDTTAVIAALTGDADLASSAIADVTIYNDSGFGCTSNNPNASIGHFKGTVEVYAASGVTVSSVKVTSSVSTDLLSGSLTLSSSGNNVYKSSDSESNPACVTMDKEITYTIAASLSNGSTVTKTVKRTHLTVPEAQAQYNLVPLGRDSSNATVVSEKRPLITWSPPEDVLITIPTAPIGSAIRYTYEFSHVDTSQSQQGPASQCNSVTAGSLYAVDSFLPTVDCDVTACAATLGVDAGKIACRINIQTYLVDQYDRLLGQAAGNFTWFCVDTNGDGDCGN